MHQGPAGMAWAHSTHVGLGRSEGPMQAGTLGPAGAAPPGLGVGFSFGVSRAQVLTLAMSCMYPRRMACQGPRELGEMLP